MNWVELASEIAKRVDDSEGVDRDWNEYLNLAHSLQFAQKDPSSFEGSISKEELLKAAGALSTLSQKIMTKSFYSKLWLCNKTTIPPITEVFQITIRSHRSLSNLFGPLHLSVIGLEALRLVLLDSLYTCLPALLSSTKSQESRTKANQLQIFLSSLDSSVLRRWVITMLQDTHTSSLVIELMDSHWIAKALSLLLASLQSTSLNSSLLANQTSLISVMMAAILKDTKDVPFSALRIIERVILPWPAALSIDFLLPLIKQSPLYPALFDYTVSILGDKSFLQSGERHKQQTLTTVLIALLPPTSPQSPDSFSLQSKGVVSKLTLEILLTHTMSAVLDSSDEQIRYLGMKILRAWSDGLGGQIDLPELDEPPTPASAAKNETTEAGKDDSDSDSDLEAFANPLGEDLRYGEDSLKIPELHTRYLRQCLQLLRTSETEANARVKHLAALERIPELIADGAADAADLSPLLVEQLINLPNAFNLEGFEELRMRCMVSLVEAEPERALPPLTNALFSTEISIGLKRKIIVWMRRAAGLLANVIPHNKSGDSLPNLPSLSTSSAVSSSSPSKKEGSLGSTTIKKPLTLKAKQVAKKSAVNRFHKVGGDFFYPLIKLLLDLLQTKEDPIYKKSEFNKISELFPSQTTSSKPIRVSMIEKAAQLAGVDTLLPAEALLALSNMLQYGIYSTHISKFSSMAIEVAQLYRGASDLSIRRAVLCTVYMSLDSVLKHAESITTSLPPRLGALDSLLHISEDEQILEKQSMGRELVMSNSMVDCLEWIIDSYTNDTDEESRTLKGAIIKICQETIDQPAAY